MNRIEDEYSDLMNEFLSLFKKYGYIDVLGCINDTLLTETSNLRKEFMATATDDHGRRSELFTSWYRANETCEAINAVCLQLKARDTLADPTASEEDKNMARSYLGDEKGAES